MRWMLIAKKKGVSVAQVALAWLLAQPGVTSIIIGANKMSQLEDNLKAADFANPFNPSPQKS